ncbi:MAG: hypothetical protein AAGA53_04640 [Pseudomonadota bacterium]
MFEHAKLRYTGAAVLALSLVDNGAMAQPQTCDEMYEAIVTLEEEHDSAVKNHAGIKVLRTCLNKVAQALDDAAAQPVSETESESPSTGVQMPECAAEADIPTYEDLVVQITDAKDAEAVALGKIKALFIELEKHKETYDDGCN